MRPEADPAAPAAPTGPLLGAELELVVGAVAHGGHCVARHEGRVVFVRHALPGELVRARVTEDRGKSFVRADAVRVLRAAEGRVEPPCPHAGPGRCGGCDWQHATPATQRALKTAVVREQLARLAGLDVPVTVEEVPGGALGWRTRVGFGVDATGTVGLHRHRSEQIEPVRHCPLGTAAVDAVGASRVRWPGVEAVEVVVSSVGDRAVVVSPRPGADVGVPKMGEPELGEPAADDPERSEPGSDLPGSNGTEPAVLERTGRRRVRRVRGHRAVRERVGDRELRVCAAGFWQVHPAAPATILAAMLAGLAPQPGDSALDLYAGAGLLSAALGPRLGSTGRLVAVESDREAVRDLRTNLRDAEPAVRVEAGRVEAVLRRLTGAVDVVVLDPPRTGAGASVARRIAGLRPRAICYVACDPAALARDLATFAGLGYRLAGLRAFDLFPMTHHVECVATLHPVSTDSAAPGAT